MTHSFPTRRSSDLYPGCQWVKTCWHKGERMIAAALTSPCLIRSDGRTITIEKPQFIECADGRFSAGVAGIPLRHATYSGTDLEQGRVAPSQRSEEHTSELQSLMRISYAVFCLTQKKQITNHSTMHLR